jgi:hypothetical protein
VKNNYERSSEGLLQNNQILRRLENMRKDKDKEEKGK